MFKHNYNASVRLPESMWAQVQRDARLLKKSPSAVVRDALEAYFRV